MKLIKHSNFHEMLDEKKKKKESVMFPGVPTSSWSSPNIKVKATCQVS